MALLLQTRSALRQKYKDQRNQNPQQFQSAVTFDSQQSFFQENATPRARLSPKTPNNLNNKNNTEFSQFLRRNNSLLDNLSKKDDHYIRNLVHSPHLDNIDAKTYIRNCHADMQYSLKNIQCPDESYLQKKITDLSLGKNAKEKVLFLDLDNTLIKRCSPGETPDHSIKARNSKGQIIQIGINLRPYIFQFLKLVSKYYEVFIFSTLSKHLTKTIVNFLDPLRKYIKGFLSRENCLLTNKGYFIKDLRIVNNKDLSQIVILDSSINSFAFQIDNGIPILGWDNDRKDQELYYVLDYLIQLSHCNDVRIMNKKKFQLEELGNKHLYEIQL